MSKSKNKICKECNIEKSMAEYHSCSKSKDGLKNKCKECRSSFQKEYYFLNKKEINEKARRDRKENPEKYRKLEKERYIKNRESRLKQAKAYREKNKSKISAVRKAKYATKEYKEYKKQYDKEYRRKNKKELRVKDRIRKRNKYRTDPEFRLRNRISNTVRIHLLKNKSNKNKKSILQYLPYSIAQLKEHLENQFEDWMTWDNYGMYKTNENKTWQIDHIRPQSKLKYDSMEHLNFKKCWALENLRPLEAIKNLKKSDK